jgi:hypothetical protein
MQARVMRHVYARVEPLLTALHRAAFSKHDKRKNKKWGPAGEKWAALHNLQEGLYN